MSLPFDILKEVKIQLNLKNPLDAANLQYALNKNPGIIEARVTVKGGWVIYNPKQIKKAKIQKMTNGKILEEKDVEYQKIIERNLD